MSNTLQITEQQTAVEESITLTLKTLKNDAKNDVKEEQTSNNENDAKNDLKEEQTTNNENDVKEEQTSNNESTQRVENLAIAELLNLVHEAAASENRGLMNAVCQKIADLIKDDKDTADELKKIINSLAMEELFDIVKKLYKAANNEDLFGACCQEVADRIKDKSVEEVREIFGIENDFTPEEEAAVRKENAWAYEEAAVEDA